MADNRPDTSGANDEELDARFGKGYSAMIARNRARAEQDRLRRQHRAAVERRLCADRHYASARRRRLEASERRFGRNYVTAVLRTSLELPGDAEPRHSCIVAPRARAREHRARPARRTRASASADDGGSEPPPPRRAAALARVDDTKQTLVDYTKSNLACEVYELVSLKSTVWGWA